MSQRRKLARSLRVVSVAKGGEADVYLDGPVGFPEEDGITAAQFREQLARCKGATVINVHINSPGGIVTEGMNIYAALRAHPARKVAIVEGICASIASVVLMACDERRVAKGSFVMIHNPSRGMPGSDSAALRKAADDLDQMQGEMLDIYEARTGIERSELEKMLNAETYFTAEEAVEVGIADAVEGALEAKIDQRAVARLDPEKVPAALRAATGKVKAMKGKNAKMRALEEELAKLKAMASEEDDDEPEDEEDTEEEETEDTEDEPHNASDDDSTALVATVVALTGEKDVAKATAKIASMISSGAAGAATSRKATVEAMIKAGKLLPSLRTVAMAWSEKTLRAYVKSIGGEAMLKLGRTHTPPADPPKEKPDARSESRNGKNPENVIARQFNVDVAKIKDRPLPASVKLPGEAR